MATSDAVCRCSVEDYGMGHAADCPVAVRAPPHPLADLSAALAEVERLRRELGEAYRIREELGVPALKRADDSATVERVAKAIYHARCFDGVSDETVYHWWETALAETGREAYRDESRAAIRAMREPGVAGTSKVPALKRADDSATVERVAKAMRRTDAEGIGWEDLARAAIRAMRDPGGAGTSGKGGGT